MGLIKILQNTAKYYKKLPILHLYILFMRFHAGKNIFCVSTNAPGRGELPRPCPLSLAENLGSKKNGCEYLIT